MLISLTHCTKRQYEGFSKCFTASALEDPYTIEVQKTWRRSPQSPAVNRLFSSAKSCRLLIGSLFRELYICDGWPEYIRSACNLLEALIHARACTWMLRPPYGGGNRSSQRRYLPRFRYACSFRINRNIVTSSCNQEELASRSSRRTMASVRTCSGRHECTRQA